MELLKKCLSTIGPFYDFRVLLLLFIFIPIGMLTDPAATLGLAGYLAYVIGMAAVALLLSGVLMPYLKTGEHIRSALKNHNLASALVVFARVFLLLGILVVLMAWSK